MKYQAMLMTASCALAALAWADGNLPLHKIDEPRPTQDEPRPTQDNKSANWTVSCGPAVPEMNAFINSGAPRAQLSGRLEVAPDGVHAVLTQAKLELYKPASQVPMRKFNLGNVPGTYSTHARGVHFEASSSSVVTAMNLDSDLPRNTSEFKVGGKTFKAYCQFK